MTTSGFGVCRWCDNPQRYRLVDTSTLGSPFSTSIRGRWDHCPNCHANDAPLDPPRPHRYEPPLRIVTDVDVTTVHCGPPATVPVPTPDDILHHAEGLGRALLDG